MSLLYPRPIVSTLMCRSPDLAFHDYNAKLAMVMGPAECWFQKPPRMSQIHNFAGNLAWLSTLRGETNASWQMVAYVVRATWMMHNTPLNRLFSFWVVLVRGEGKGKGNRKAQGEVQQQWEGQRQEQWREEKHK